MTPTTIKMDPKTRSLVQRAAKRRGISLSEYVRAVALEAAARDTGACVECGRPHKKVRQEATAA